MPDAMTAVSLVYAGLSLVIAGAAVTYEIWHRPVMIDRATGGKHPSPNTPAFVIGEQRRMRLGQELPVGWSAGEFEVLS